MVGGEGASDGCTAHGGHLFKMAGHLKYEAVAATMAFIIVFTIFCEKLVARVKRWITYFNPLLHPCVDKVISELMILGATAFLILTVNESTNNGLSNGDFMPVHWYHTLHWIDTVIFVFALVYVVVAAWCLFLLCENLTSWLARADAQVIHDMFVDGSERELRASHAHRKGSCCGLSNFFLRKRLQYCLLKRHFKKIFFPEDESEGIDIDFVFYIEVALIFGITSCFNIRIWDWMVLFGSCLVIVKSYVVFSFCCFVLLFVSVAVMMCLPVFFYEILKGSFGIRNPHSIQQLELAIDGTVKEKQRENMKGGKTAVGSSSIGNSDRNKSDGNGNADKGGRAEGSGRSGDSTGHAKRTAFPFCCFRVDPMVHDEVTTLHHFFHHSDDPHVMRNAARHRMLSVRPEKRKVYLFGVPLTQELLRKFVQLQLLVTCFYLAVFLCTYRFDKRLQLFIPTLACLVVNLVVVTPTTMMFGFTLASIINVDIKSVQTISKLRRKGETTLVFFKILFLEALSKAGGESCEAQIKEVFDEWSSFSYPRGLLSSRDIRTLIIKWAHTNGHEDLDVDRPKLLALMRIVDSDRSGHISLKEFRVFARSCIEDHGALERQAQNSSRSPTLREASAEVEQDRRKSSALQQQKKEQARVVI